MSNVYFEPWVGCQYSEGINGIRIMVLGHACYFSYSQWHEIIKQALC